MRRQIGQLAALLIWGAGLGLAVLSYNLWTYRCSSCPAPPIFSLGLVGYGFLGLIGVALLILIVLRWRRKTTLARGSCDCGIHLDKDWNFCPACGTPRPA